MLIVVSVVFTTVKRIRRGSHGKSSRGSYGTGNSYVKGRTGRAFKFASEMSYFLEVH